MPDFLPMKSAFFALAGRGKAPDPIVLAVFGGVLMLGGLLLIGSHLMRKRGVPSEGGGAAFVVGVVLASLGYGLAARGLHWPGSLPSLQLAGWIVALGLLSLPWLLRRWEAMGLKEADGSPKPDPFAGAPEERLARIVEEGETILWTGRPKTRRFLIDAFVLAFFGQIPIGFGVAMTYGIVRRINQSGVEWDFLVAQVLGLEVAVLFLCFGGMLFISPWMVPMRLERVVYAVTDRRGLVSAPPYSIWDPIPMRSRSSVVPEPGVPMEFSPTELTGGQRKRKWFGTSDLVFVSVMSGSGKNRHRVDYGFLGISDVDAAQAAIDEASPPTAAADAAEPRRRRGR